MVEHSAIQVHRHSTPKNRLTAYRANIQSIDMHRDIRQQITDTVTIPTCNTTPKTPNSVRLRRWYCEKNTVSEPFRQATRAQQDRHSRPITICPLTYARRMDLTRHRQSIEPAPFPTRAKRNFDQGKTLGFEYPCENPKCSIITIFWYPKIEIFLRRKLKMSDERSVMRKDGAGATQEELNRCGKMLVVIKPARCVRDVYAEMVEASDCLEGGRFGSEGVRLSDHTVGMLKRIGRKNEVSNVVGNDV